MPDRTDSATPGSPEDGCGMGAGDGLFCSAPAECRVALATLGCKVNQVETEALREQFALSGYRIVDFAEQADLYIINTCAVTRMAEKKSRALMRRAKKRNPHGLVVVTGCYGQTAQADLEKLPEVDLIIPNPDKEYLIDQIDRFLGRCDRATVSSPHLRQVEYTFHHPRTRGFIKIQDGCESFCSYCIVPRARGRVRSKQPEHVLAEAQSMLDHDHRELVLSGIHLGQYGKDLDGWNLFRLVRYLLRELTGEYRIRLGSLEPNELTEELAELVTGHPRLCNHLHIPLQSGSNVILQAMNRHYTAGQYLALLERLHFRQPKLGLTADVMVGFPGEGDQEFKATRHLIEESPLNDLHVFRYSQRPGTPAAIMPHQVGEAVKNERSQELIEVGRRQRTRFLKALLNTDLQVLTEENTTRGPRGLSDNYVEVLILDPTEINRFYNVRIEKAEAGILLGKVVGGPIPANA